ncbi:MAG: glycosyltransferase [Victivallaceae bacterium]|nr:glycosyltransferase [Victivallaceae bacterium]
MNRPDISVVVPFYNDEKFIEQTALSLFRQMHSSMEYIFIDDASTDAGNEKLQKILNAFPARREQVRIIRHSVNKGVTFSRMEGMRIASGRYMIHCDGDDWVEADMYEVMFAEAVRQNADMVYCHHVREETNGRRIECIEPELHDYDAIVKAMFGCRMHCSLWNKLYRSDLIKNLRLDCPDFININEDLRMNVQMLKACHKIVQVPRFFYHYRVNPVSLTCENRGRKSFLAEEDNAYFFQAVARH